MRPVVVVGGGRGRGRVARPDSFVAFDDVKDVDCVLSAIVDGDVRIVFDSSVTVNGDGGDGVSGDFGGADDWGFGLSVVAGRGDVDDADASVVTLGGDLIDGRYGCSQPSSTNAAVDEDEDEDAHADTRGRYLYDGLAERL